MSQFVVCALYKFVTLDNYRELRETLFQAMQENQVRGTLLLAPEGINGTVSGSRQGIDALLEQIRSIPPLADIDYKESFTDRPPFKRTRVKLKKEIVTMGVPGIDPKQVVGTYVSPGEWNQLISDPDVLLVDTRNDYEVQVGTFRNAVNPGTDTFREFPGYVKDRLDPEKHKKVAMFCTGGIRCEKSTAYLKEQGFDEVYHLKGGILKYLEEVPAEDTLWEGECFVFDDRVTVNNRLEKGSYEQCNACRMPVTAADRASEKFRQGVSCPHCFDTLTTLQKARFQERQHQMELASQRGDAHMGDAAVSSSATNREAKAMEKERQRSSRTKQTA
jgi:UPF0176 protein